MTTEKKAEKFPSRNITIEHKCHFTYELATSIFRDKVKAHTWRNISHEDMTAQMEAMLTAAFPNLLDKKFCKLWGADLTSFSREGLREACSNHPTVRAGRNARNVAFPSGYNKRDNHKFYDNSRALERGLFDGHSQHPIFDEEWKPPSLKFVPQALRHQDRWRTTNSVEFFAPKKVITKDENGDPGPIVYRVEPTELIRKHLGVKTVEPIMRIAVQVLADVVKLEALRLECFDLTKEIWEGISFYKTTKKLEEGWNEMYDTFMECNGLNKPVSKALVVNPVDVHALSKKIAGVMS